ncbi:Pc21g17400 [Penicillium rubens Wisconsin 54-1255]|uniref:Pc21g17400 protein n=1 Tax=Penicillium rubens (strain ATCC 28089 / DSM 1075 / NRRL 1951 / Wisconsin 54-1255) TaxID=500485 RepID=B6HMI3_PENRW|nr:Pc21g17400 [Penicillium rubens Wisconsin 54-1255]
MHVNKRIGRFKQWAGERMGGEAKTCLSDDFKAMETEMGVNHTDSELSLSIGVDRIHKSMTSYVKAISKRNEGDDKEKTLPIAHLGTSMVAHGEDFDGNSEYGQCLIMFGRTEERIARIQENYIAQATSSWLESLERSLTQMKDLQHARKKLDSRRLAYDTSLSKMEKAKKEDFRVEEELRSQKVKYEEASDDVLRRMQDIKEAEADNVMDMGVFLDAQLEYHERSREALLQLKNEWTGYSQVQAPPRRPTRPRSNTAHSYQERYEPLQEELMNATETRPPIRSNRSITPYSESPPRETYGNTGGVSRPVLNRVPTFEGPAQLRHEQSPVASQWIQQRTASENLGGFGHRSSTQVGNGRISADPYADSEEVSSYGRSSPERMFSGGRSISPATSHGSVPSRRPSATNLNTIGSKKAPPPPPPSRAKKPPPPPPMKRSLLAAPNA